MNRIIRLRLATVLIALACGACSEPEDVESASAPLLSVFGADSDQPGSVADREGFSDTELPLIESVVFEPERPLGGERLRVVPRVQGGVTSIRYDWQLNGVEFGNNAAEIPVPTISKGDEIVVRLTPLRGVIEGEPFEASVRARNQRPMIVGLDIEHVDDFEDEEPGAAGRWRAVVSVGDPDEESVEIEYRWYVNGVEAEEDEDTIRLEGLTRGDRIAVHVRATDGVLWSPLAKSGEIAIGNAPPQIVSTPPRLGPGGLFRYAVRASDGDRDDRLEYSLRNAPRGMHVSEADGIVTWQPDAEQAGRHEIEVVVTDGNGGEAVQSFVLSLVASSSTAPAAPF